MADEKISLLPLAVTPLNPDLFVIVNSGVTSRITWASILAALPSGSGTVTSVAWTTSQGVSASISNATTTPNITITLGALTGITSLNGLVITPNTGVITTGTWNASLITGQYGGTGVANTGKTITLGGNLVTSGAFDTTFSASATATYTLPASTSTLLANSLGLSGGTTIIGGTGITDDLIFRTTSGAGTTGADFIWQSGNNGATELMRLINSGTLILGATSAIGSEKLSLQGNVNSNFGTLTKNSSTGTTAAAYAAFANSASSASFGITSTGFTPYGREEANCFFLYTNNAAGIDFMVDANGPITFSTGTGAPALERWRISGTGQLSNTGANGTAYITLKAGTSTASSAPLKLTTGTSLTTPEAGALEFTTDSLFFTGTTGTTRKTLADFSYRGISALRTLDGSDELVNITTGTFTVTLPTAVGYTKKYIIKNSGTGIVTLATTSSQTIDGFASGIWTLNPLDQMELRSDTANWIRTK